MTVNSLPTALLIAAILLLDRVGALLRLVLRWELGGRQSCDGYRLSFIFSGAVLSALLRDLKSSAPWLSVAAILLLTGCETVKPLTTRIETVQIKVPIAIPCIAKADVPVVPNLAAPVNGSPDQMAAWVSALVLLLDRYTDEADIIIRGCAGK